MTEKPKVNYSYTKGVTMKFFNRVKETREGVSIQRQNRNEPPILQEDLAETVGCSRVTINKIERGVSEPSVGLALKISQALGVDPFELFPIQPVGQPLVQSKIGEQKPLAPELVELARVFNLKTPVYRS